MLQNLVNELHERPNFPTPVIMEIEPQIEIKNILSVLVREEVVKKKNNKKSKRKSIEYENVETTI